VLCATDAREGGTQCGDCWHAGYGILGPYARAKGWAPGEIMDWKTGATGWILWVSLAIMLGDSLTSLSLLVITSTKCSKYATNSCQVLSNKPIQYS
jgi:hypothetical protein